MRTKAAFHDPGDIPVEIVLVGTLAEFERMGKALQPSVPDHGVSVLRTQINDVAFKLRKVVAADIPEEKQ